MQTHDVYLTTSWVAPYHDLVKEGLKVCRAPTPLRTQTQNANREDDLFWKGSIPPMDPKTNVMQIWYQAEQVNRLGSVLAAMAHCTKIDFQAADYSLPIPPEWHERLMHYLRGKWDGRPIMIYRPLVERNEWGGCSARNPDIQTYYELYTEVRKDFFVISIADLVPRVEWMTSIPIQADLEFHRGELQFQELSALFALASLVYCSPGFAAPLASAVGTPNIVVFGGFEKPTSFTAGRRHAPHLSVGPKNPCGCWKHTHDCPKEIDKELAVQHIHDFVQEYVYADPESNARVA
jgi:hypothetical protein